MRIERLDLDEWGEALPDRGFEVFHTPEALSVLDRHTAGELELYGGFNGQRVVGLFPIFARRLPYGTIVTSPPPFLGARMGPIVMPSSPKQRKRDELNRTFTNKVLSELDVTDNNVNKDQDTSLPDLLRSRFSEHTTLFRTACNVDYSDPRPYVWNGFTATPEFTYRIDVDSLSQDDLLMSFSKSLRRDIRNGQDIELTVETEGISSAREIYYDITQRYEEQGSSFSLDWEFVRDLIVELGDGCRIYVVRDPDGDYLSGIITLYSNDTAYNWIGGTRGTHDGVGVNGLLNWQIISDLYEDDELDSITRYDLHGANNYNLCRFKSKFSGELIEYYVVESSGIEMGLAKRVYKLINRYL